MEIKDLIKENVAFHCDTTKKADELLKKAHQLGYKWCDGVSYLAKNPWDNYKEQTCYDILMGTFCNYTRYHKDNYKIIDYILDKDFVKPIILDCVVLHDGQYCCYLQIKNRCFYFAKINVLRMLHLIPADTIPSRYNAFKSKPLQDCFTKTEINTIEFLYNQLIQNDCSEIQLESNPKNKEDYVPIIYKLNLVDKHGNKV